MKKQGGSLGEFFNSVILGPGNSAMKNYAKTQIVRFPEKNRFLLLYMLPESYTHIVR